MWKVNRTNLNLFALDKPLTMTDGLGVTSFGYDNAGRLSSTDGPWANDTLSYAYDADGRRSALGVELPNGQNDVTSYAYDALGRLDSLTSSAGTFDYSYAGNTGRIAQLLMPNGTKTTYSYTALGELNVLRNLKADGSNISSYNYDTDARGVRTRLQEQIEADPVKTLLFSYDPANQLTGEQVSGGKTGEAYTASYAYDTAGNRTRHENTSGTDSTVTLTSNNKLNQALGVETTHNGGTPSASALSYDAAGNLARVSSSGGRSDYVFDDSNRLVQIVSRNEQGQATSKSEFVYDGMNRLRISSDYDYENGAWVSRGEKRRLCDGMDAVQERDGTGALVATYTRGLSMGGGIGGLLARTFEGGTSFYHYDGRGNVTGLSDTAGAVSGKYSYDAFGNTLSASGGAAGLNPYRFSTKEQIGGLVYYGFRFYSPGLGKWINRDPLQEEGGLNLYGFVENNPVNDVDEYGEQPTGWPKPPGNLPGGPYEWSENPGNPRGGEYRGPTGTGGQRPSLTYSPNPRNPDRGYWKVTWPGGDKQRYTRPGWPVSEPEAKGREGRLPWYKNNLPRPYIPRIPPAFGRIPAPVAGGIIVGGAWAGWELYNYSPGRPSGPLTWIGDTAGGCVGDWLYPSQ